MAQRYDFFLASPLLGATQYETEFDFGGTHVFVSTCVVEGLRCFFIEPQNGFFATETVYGRKDDGMRFEFFCKARTACRPYSAGHKFSYLAATSPSATVLSHQ